MTLSGETAVPVWGRTAQLLSSLSPKRDCRQKKVKKEGTVFWKGVCAAVATEKRAHDIPEQKHLCISIYISYRYYQYRYVRVRSRLDRIPGRAQLLMGPSKQQRVINETRRSAVANIIPGSKQAPHTFPKQPTTVAPAHEKQSLAPGFRRLPSPRDYSQPSSCLSLMLLPLKPFIGPQFH